MPSGISQVKADFLLSPAFGYICCLFHMGILTMTWRYILKQLGFPPSSLLLLLLLAWLLRKKLPKIAGLFFFCALLALYLLSIPASVQFLAQKIETEPALPHEHWSTLAQRADAIVVLGGGREMADAAWRSDQPSLFTQQRLRYAARLARASQLPILVSGGLHFGEPPSEAQLAADSLARDFNLEAHWLEGSSRTTWENALHSARILQEQGIHDIVLVTDAWHMPRARWSFEQFGFNVVSAPQGFWSRKHARPALGLLPESKAFWQNTQLLNEWLGNRLYQQQYGAGQPP